MPKASKAPKEPKTKTTKAAKNSAADKQLSLADQTPAPANPHGLPLVYTKLEVVERSTSVPIGPFMPDDARIMLGMETDREYQQRMVSLNGGKSEHYLFGEAVADEGGVLYPVHYVNLKGEKVVCWNNAGNRPFDQGWAEALRDTILFGQWAGPHTAPGETINGETIRVSRYGRVLSGQHQGTGLVMADEELARSRNATNYDPAYPKYPFWNGHDHPFIETLVVFGLSEDERILRTIDYGKPRTIADMLYTMELFRNNTPAERRELTKLLEKAIDVLWDRTRTLGYKTHPEVVSFLERHKRLLKACEHIFVENRKDADAKGGRIISRLRVSAGTAAAFCYLMGSSGPKTDGDEYRNESPPSERGLDWSLWDQAREFWHRLAADQTFLHVRTALTDLDASSPTHPTNPGLGGKPAEKTAIIAKAWRIFSDHPESSGPPFNKDDLATGGALRLAYLYTDEHGVRLPPDVPPMLLDDDDLMGIDCPGRMAGKERHTAPMPPPISAAEIEAAAEAERQRRPDDSKRRKDAPPPSALDLLAEQAQRRRGEHAAKLAAARAAKK